MKLVIQKNGRHWKEFNEQITPDMSINQIVELANQAGEKSVVVVFVRADSTVLVNLITPNEV